MAHWLVKISGKRIRHSSVNAFAQQMKDQFGEACTVIVVDCTPPVTRGDRFNEIKKRIEDAKDDAESLRDELQEWYDALPESLQGGDKGTELNEAISELETFISSLDDNICAEVNFPKMM